MTQCQLEIASFIVLPKKQELSNPRFIHRPMPFYTKGRRRCFPAVWPLIYTPAKVEISDNAGYGLPCQLGEIGF